LSGGALVSALAFSRRAANEGEPAPGRGVSTWFLLAMFWWCGFALHGLAHAVAYATRSADGGTAWHTISFWAAYGIGLVLSALAGSMLALRRELLAPRTLLQVFWPVLTWAGGVVFFLQATRQLHWAHEGWLRLEPTSVGAALRTLLGSPLLGALMLCSVAAYGTWYMTRSERAPDREDPARDWLIALAITWYLLLLDPIAQFLVSLLSQIGLIERLWRPRYPDVMMLLIAASAWYFIRISLRREFPALRWLAVPVMTAQAVVSAVVLGVLYLQGELPRIASGIGLAGCWLAVAWSLRQWVANGWRLPMPVLRGLHFGRVIAPWLMLMPVIALNLTRWIWSEVPEARGWPLTGQWPDYIASWLGTLALLLLLRQSERAAWPLQPLQDWYRTRLIPLATLWGVLLAAYWNLRQDGSMAPLPYVPLLNPLDLTTGFLALLVRQVWRANRAELSSAQHLALVRGALALGFAWFNLMLLRTVAQYLSVPYRFDALYASKFVQVMLSIVWMLSAFLLMYVAIRRHSKPLWKLGVTFEVSVAAKLMLIDLSNLDLGALALSFMAVGGLMVLISSLLRFPKQNDAVKTRAAEST
jgi:uncharacterized membrane protein